VDFQVNDRPRCGSPKPVISFSTSGIVHAAERNGQPPSQTLASGSVVGPEGPITVTISGVIALLGAAGQVPSVATGLCENLFGGDAEKWRFNGRSISYSSDGFTYAQVNLPYKYSRQDNCGVDNGEVFKVSITLMGFDEDTCRPFMMWQNSSSMFLASDYFDTSPYPTALLQAQIGSTSQVTNMFDAAVTDGSVPSPSQCDTIPSDMRVPWLTLLNTALTYGTP